MKRVPYHLLVRNVKQKWLKYAPKMWWGDNIDVRFYLISELKKIKSKRILDIGCNAGIILSEVEDNNYKVGIDIVPQTLSIAKRLNNGSSIIGADMLRLPFADLSFDIVILANMLEHTTKVKEKGLLIKEAHRVLKPYGTLFVTTLNRRYPRYRKFPEIRTFEELDTLLQPYFDYHINGFNPFPPFPYFLPNMVIAKIPGIWYLLVFLMKKDFLRKWCCGFFAEAIKSNDKKL